MKLQEAKYRKIRFLCVARNEKNNKITNAKADANLKDEVMKQKKVLESVKTLGVSVNPQLKWNIQCDYVKNKM